MPDAQRVRSFFHWMISGMTPGTRPEALPETARVQLADAEAGPDALRPDLIRLIESAHREWQQAYDLFNEAKDPQLVDHAIHVLAAAELQYSYYIRQAKHEYQVCAD